MTNEPMKTDEKYYPLKEAAKQAGCSQETLRKAIVQKHLPASQLPSGKGGMMYMISETNLLDWMENRKKFQSAIHGVTDLTIEDLAHEILARVQKAYEDGYKAGIRDTKAKYKELLKELG